MSVFATNVQTALNNYKAIIRKTLPPEEAAEKVKKLRLKRKQIQNAPDVVLYRTAVNVIHDIEAQIAPLDETPAWYFGLAEFLEYFKNTLAGFHVTEDNHVIHTKQHASRAIVEAIQLIELPIEKLGHAIAKKLTKCMGVVVRYGTEHQNKMLHGALEKHIDRHASFFDPLLQDFKQLTATER